jgi:hypothetical protein
VYLDTLLINWIFFNRDIRFAFTKYYTSAQ